MQREIIDNINNESPRKLEHIKNTNLVTILAEIVPVRLDNWQR